MKKKSLLIVGNGFITKENQDFFKDKHTSKFLKDCSVLFSRVGWLEPVDKVDPTKNTSIHKAKIPQEILLINSKVEVALNPFLKLIRLVSLAYFFLLYFKKFHFIYFFFFGNLSWICAFIAVFFKKPYGLYLRSEVQLKSFFNRFIINRAEFVLVNGKGLLESLKGLNQNTKLVAPMLDINTEDVYSRNMRKNIKVLKALFVGRIEERKGVFDILEAIKMLKRDGCIVECYFIGGGDDFICLQNKAEEYDLEKQIKLLGVIHEKKKLYTYYKMVDFFVLASYSEGFPRVLYEAMIFSLPILTTNVGSIGALLKDGKNALFFKKKNPKDLAQKIKALAENVNVRQRLAIDAQKTIVAYLKQFDKVHAEQVLYSIQEKYNEKILE